jgi:predicted MFS family arabinose efflux permease
MFWGSWAVATADVRTTYGFSNAQLGLLLAGAVTVSGIGGAVVGNRAERWGTVRTLTWALIVWAVLLVLAGASGTAGEFVPAFIAAMAAGGCVDMTMNAASASRLAGTPGSLVRFHGIFNIGALVGAVLLGMLVDAGGSWRWAWPAIAVLALPLAAWVRLRGADVDPEGRTDPGGGRRPAADPVAAAAARTGPEPLVGQLVTDGEGHLPFLRSLGILRSDGLVGLLVIFAAAEIVEGGVDTWGVLFLRTDLGADALVGAAAYAAGQSVAIATRILAGPSLGRIGPRLGVVVGAGCACLGLTLEATAGSAALAGAGLALAAGGAAVFWPLLMATATTAASRPTATVSTFTAAGYLGWVAGAPVIGLLADAWGLAAGLAVIAALAGAVAVSMVVFRRLDPAAH